MRRPPHITALLVLIFALLAIGAAPALAASPYVTESCLTPSLPTNQQASSVTYWPEIRYATIAVFEDDRNGNWDIYASDLWTPWEQQVTTDPANQRHPAASGSWIAYEDGRNGNLDVYLVNLTSGVETRLTSSLATQRDPAVTGGEFTRGTRVVWEDQRNGNWDIYLYDVDAETTKRLTTGAAAQLDPAIDGKRVVWADHRNGNWDVYLYDAGKKTTTRLTTNGADQMAPAIQGTMVVYQDHRNGDWDIYGYDLATKKERRLTRNAADQTSPALSPRRERSPMIPGWRVVYQDTRNGGSDIYLTDIPAGGECRLTDDAADQIAPAIWGGQVVWTDLRDTSSGLPAGDIYVADLAIPWLSASVDPDVVKYNGTAKITGSLVEEAGAIAGAKVVRFVRVGAGDRATTASTVTDSYGRYVLRVQDIKAKARYRTVFRGDATHLPAVSDIVTVRAKAWLSTPAIPKSFSYQKTVTVSCFLKPRHRAGSYPVKFLFYHYTRGDGIVLWDWVFWKTVKGRAANYSTYTKCSTKVTFPKPSGPYPGATSGASSPCTKTRPTP